MSKPLSYTVSTKSGKPQGTNFPSHTLSSHLFTPQPTRTYNLIGPTRPCHYPLQHYTTSGVFTVISTLLKLIFYQVTYIAAIFSKGTWFILGIPRWWWHYLVFNLMVTTFEAAKTFHSTICRLMQTSYSATKQVGMLSYSLDIRVLLG